MFLSGTMPWTPSYLLSWHKGPRANSSLFAHPKSLKHFSSKHQLITIPDPSPDYESNHNLHYRYICVEEIPAQYGGLKREKDTEFSIEDGGVTELVVKAGSTETIEIPVPEVCRKDLIHVSYICPLENAGLRYGVWWFEQVGTTLVWDLTVLGWEVNYKEEFVPADEGSYTIIIQKGKKMGSQEEPVRNSFRNNEPGKVVLTIENSVSKKKRIFYRYKTKNCSSFWERLLCIIENWEGLRDGYRNWNFFHSFSRMSMILWYDLFDLNTLVLGLLICLKLLHEFFSPLLIISVY